MYSMNSRMIQILVRTRGRFIASSSHLPGLRKQRAPHVYNNSPGAPERDASPSRTSPAESVFACYTLHLQLPTDDPRQPFRFSKALSRFGSSVRDTQYLCFFGDSRAGSKSANSPGRSSGLASEATKRPCLDSDYHSDRRP
jgi:hypothetical protein